MTLTKKEEKVLRAAAKASKVQRLMPSTREAMIDLAWGKPSEFERKLVRRATLYIKELQKCLALLDN
jgi:hypothetical protein